MPRATCQAGSMNALRPGRGSGLEKIAPFPGTAMTRIISDNNSDTQPPSPPRETKTARANRRHRPAHRHGHRYMVDGKGHAAVARYRQVRAIFWK